jgi:site-specific recombinase XerD
MTHSVDDVHSFDTGFLRAKERLRNAEISQENKDLIENFIVKCQIEGLAKGTLVGYLNYITRMVQRLKELGIDKPLNTLTEDDFNRLLVHLQNEHGLKSTSLRTYKKVTKKFFRVVTSGESPKWVQNLKLKTIDTPVQPSDILTQKEFDNLMEACRHPRDKALIAVLADSGIRVGALASCRIKSVEFNQYGAILYLSKTGLANKTTSAKGIPLTWSTGYLNQWLAVHPLKEDQDAPSGSHVTRTWNP